MRIGARLAMWVALCGGGCFNEPTMLPLDDGDSSSGATQTEETAPSDSGASSLGSATDPSGTTGLGDAESGLDDGSASSTSGPPGGCGMVPASMGTCDSQLPSTLPLHCTDFIVQPAAELSCSTGPTTQAQVYDWTPPAPGGYIVSTLYSSLDLDDDTVVEVRDQAGTPLACADQTFAFSAWGDLAFVHVDLATTDPVEIEVHTRNQELSGIYHLVIAEVGAPAPSCCSAPSDACESEHPDVFCCVADFDSFCTDSVFDAACRAAAAGACFADC